jgi:hypothetical protein
MRIGGLIAILLEIKPNYFNRSRCIRGFYLISSQPPEPQAGGDIRNPE